MGRRIRIHQGGLVSAIPLLVLSVMAGADGLAISGDVYSAISKAQQYLENTEHQRARQVLEPMLSREHLNAYERSLLQRASGSAAISAGDYAAAIAHFEEVLQGPFLPVGASERIRHRLAQLYLHAQRYDDALALWADQVSESICSSAQLCFLIASVHAGAERWPEALEWAERGLVQEVSPLESQYAFVADLNLAAGRVERGVELFTLLTDTYPQRARYWRQLSAAYLESGNSDRAVAVFELGYLQGVLVSAADIDRLANLYLYAGVPRRAAGLLERVLREEPLSFGGSCYHLLGKAWFAAREYSRAAAVLEKAVGYFRLHEDHSQEAAFARRLRLIAQSRVKGETAEPGSFPPLQ